MLLTIGQLAAYCGVTVRAVRYYHQRGLLAEPARDASGYRRYDAQTVVDLIRIKVLTDAGVPLAQVRRLLAADPDGFSAGVAGIDQALQQRIGDLEERRRQLAGLLAGDRLVLPAEIAGILEQMRAIGVSEPTVNLERDGWIILGAACPDRVPGWARQKRAALADPEFRHLYLACDRARDWAPNDPRLEELAAWMVDWAANHRDEIGGAQPDGLRADPGAQVAEGLINAQLADAFPAWRRLAELSSQLSPALSRRHSRAG
jgi:DNA-binding transcriptional MerR regulator